MIFLAGNTGSHQYQRPFATDKETTVYDDQTTFDQIKAYYGEILSSNEDLQTSACCCSESLPPAQRVALALIDNEILKKFYGRDAFISSRLVGSQGKVIGVDMTGEQLAVAKRHVVSQASRFGYASPNTEFRQGYIEDLAAAGIADNSIDLVISNCVINLSPRKEQVFREIFRVLKPGGELYFSDVFAGRRIPAKLRNDPVLRGECLGGALYIEDFRRMLQSLGCADYRQMSRRRIALSNPALEEKIGMVDFHSITVRAFKLELEDICEDYGQTATYLGTIAGNPHAFALDDHHLFVTGKPMLVCGNTAAMVQHTRFSRHFRVTGDTSVHFGPFDCSPAAGAAEVSTRGGGCC
jgi:arsenite methyltransferase